jgi:hypothetical protein
MPDLVVTVQDRNTIPAAAAARIIATALTRANITVELKVPVSEEDLPPNAVLGGTALVQVTRAAEGAGKDSYPAQTLTWQPSGSALSSLARVAIGAVLVLMLLGAELRLRFGLRLDMFITLAAIWAYWRLCLRQNQSATL